MLTRTLSRPLSSSRAPGEKEVPSATLRAGARRAALLALSCSLAVAFSASDAFAGQLPVSLGKSGSFAALAGSTVTSTGLSTLNGDLGVWPGKSLTGFPPGRASGTVHAGDLVAMAAQADLTIAYNDAASRQPPQALPADVGGRTLAPGVYKTGATPALGVTGTLTLDGQGDPGAVFVFQVGSALTTAVNSHVNLIGGAKPGNVFWQIGSSATLGTSSTFAGSILALTSISIDSGVTLNGRALARNGAVTLINDTINVPTPTPTKVANKFPRARPAPCGRRGWPHFDRAWSVRRPVFGRFYLPRCRVLRMGFVDRKVGPNDTAKKVGVPVLAPNVNVPLVDAEKTTLAFMVYDSRHHRLRFLQKDGRTPLSFPAVNGIPARSSFTRGRPGLGFSRGCMAARADTDAYALMVILNVHRPRPTRAFVALNAIRPGPRQRVIKAINARGNDLGCGGPPAQVLGSQSLRFLTYIPGDYFGSKGPARDANHLASGGQYPSGSRRTFYDNKPMGEGPPTGVIFTSTTAVQGGGIVRSVISGDDTVLPLDETTYADPNACNAPHVRWQYVEVFHQGNATGIFGFASEPVPIPGTPSVTWWAPIAAGRERGREALPTGTAGGMDGLVTTLPDAIGLAGRTAATEAGLRWAASGSACRASALLGDGSDEDLVDVDVRGLGDRVEHGAGDVLGFQGRFGTVVEEGGAHHSRFDQSHAHSGAVQVLASGFAHRGHRVPDGGVQRARQRAAPRHAGGQQQVTARLGERGDGGPQRERGPQDVGQDHLAPMLGRVGQEPRPPPKAALANATSRRPKALSVSATIRCCWSESVTSHLIASARSGPPSSCARAWRRSAERAASAKR